MCVAAENPESDRPLPETAEGRTPERLRLEREMALLWLAGKWPEPRLCAICKHSDWTVGDVVEARFFAGGGLNFGDLYAYVPVTCTNCGNALFFNAIQMGLFKGKARE